MDGCGLVLMCQSIPLHVTNRPRLCSIQYIMYFAVRGLTLLRHPLKDVLDRLRFELASIARACAVLLCEQDVVILLAFERWVEVHKIKRIRP